MRIPSTVAFGLLLVAALFTPAADLPNGVFDPVGGSAVQHPDRPLAFDFSPDGKHLTSGGADGAVRVWDVRKQTLLHTRSVKDGLATRLRYLADGTLLFVHFGDEVANEANAAKKRVRRYSGAKTLGYATLIAAAPVDWAIPVSCSGYATRLPAIAPPRDIPRP